MDLQKEFEIAGHKFTMMEFRDLAISALVLGFIFSIALSGFEYTTGGSIIVNYLISLVIVAPALILHELAHKFVAQNYGCKAGYVLWPTGVLIAVLVTILTNGRVIFAALGAVMISTHYPTRLGYRFVGLSSMENGKIAASGPAVNIILAIISYILMPLSPTIFQISATINGIIALFNLIPFPPLDGSKIFGWSRIVWLSMLATAGVLLWLPGVIGIFWTLLIAILLVIVIFVLLNYFAPYHRPGAVYR